MATAESSPALRVTLGEDDVRDAGAHSPIVLPGAPWNRLSDHAPLAAVIDL